MFSLCVESSHQKGMGHLFRCLNLLKYLKSKAENCIVLINDHKPSLNLLQERRVKFKIVDLTDTESNWESKLIQKYEVNVWLNDRLSTDVRHAAKVKKNNTLLVTFDDLGNGAALSDLHFSGLVFEDAHKLKGRKIFTGLKYLILDSEIDRYKRLRTKMKNLIVSMGGSDTYGVTVKVVQMLKELGQDATIHMGPSFEHKDELQKVVSGAFKVIKGVPSLIRSFYAYDLAITGGGITPVEANASGLPCVIIANETHEIPLCKFLNSKGSSRFLCYHRQLDKSGLAKMLECQKIDIESMSRQGLMSIPTNAVELIYREIKRAIKNRCDSPA